MRIHLIPKAAGAIEFGLIYGGIALIAVAAARILPVEALMPACIFHGLTGLPCPTCGATRSVVHLAHGAISRSLAMNPLVAVLFIAAAGCFLYGLVFAAFGLPRPVLRLSPREQDAVRAGAVLAVLANWIYLIVAR